MKDHAKRITSQAKAGEVGPSRWKVLFFWGPLALASAWCGITILLSLPW